MTESIDDLAMEFDVFNDLFFANEEFPVIPQDPGHSTNCVFADPEDVEKIDFSIVNASSSSSEARKEEGKVCRKSDPSVNEKMTLAVRYIMESHKEDDVLIQFWIPKKIHDSERTVLTTYDQPFQLDSNCRRLVDYRTVSTTYNFSAGIDSDGAFGLPGRVFVGKVPEWTPDVRLFSSFEYPRVNHAQHFDIRGSLALPVFDLANKSCLGVLEVVMTTGKNEYSSDLDNICKALRAVDLGSSEILIVPRVKLGGDSYRSVLPEIHHVLRTACTQHNLPLAQTWIPCHQQGKTGSRHISENYNECISTVDLACYVNDPAVFSFHRACSEHHLLKGQGVAGKAFTTNQPCFVSDMASFSRMEYPLSHHAKMFNLTSAVAVRLRSIHTRTDDFVLELFLPSDCIGVEEQKLMLNSLSRTIQHHCRSLRVLYAHEITEIEIEIESIDATTLNQPLPHQSLHGGDATNNLISRWDAGIVQEEADIHHHQKLNIPIPSKTKIINSEEGVSQGIEKRRATKPKTEKSISLHLLQQYFSGSLKDAAKSLGVCPTTLKRICRQHGIARWPSRKIKKVSHSLKKLQLVINSVQGTDQEHFPLSSFYTNLSNAHELHSFTQPDTNGFGSVPASASSGSWSYSSKPSILIEDKTAGPTNHNNSSTNKGFEHGFRFKVICGEEIVRFRFMLSGYKQLKKEIADRFKLALTCFDLKYLDDDSEWVLLTCDADVRECVDIYRSSGIPTVKIVVQLHDLKN